MTEPSTEAKDEAVNLMRQPIASLMQLFEAMEILWSPSPSSRFTIHPMSGEMRLRITHYLIGHPFLSKLEKGMKEQLLTLFIDSHSQNLVHKEAALKEGREFCAKLAKLAFRAWRQEHYDYFYQSTARAKFNDAYDMVYESLLKNLMLGKDFPRLNGKAYTSFLQRYCYNPIIAPQLQKTIIRGIAKLAPEDFKTSTLKKLIKEAIAAHTVAPSKAANSKRKHDEVEIDYPAQAQREEAQSLKKKR